MLRPSFQRVIASLSAALVATVGLVASAQGVHRCEAMGLVAHAPCCDDVALGAGGGAELAPSCCVLEAHRPVPAAAEETAAPVVDAAVAPLALPAPLLVASGPAPFEQDRGPASGPPLRLRDCSLLI